MKKMDNTFKKIVKLILIITFLINVKYTKAQEAEAFGKNAAYVTYGNIILSSQVSISYERTIFEKNKMRTNAKVNYGKYLNNNGDYDTNAILYENFLSLSAVQLIGLLELNAGLAFTEYKSAEGFEPEPDVDYSKVKQRIDFYGNIGVRYTKNRFLIRAGIGNLELLYVGIGTNF